MRLTDRQLSLVLGNAEGHGTHYCPSGECRCAGAIAAGHLDYWERMAPADLEVAGGVSCALANVAHRRNVETNDLYATPDTLIGALEAAGLA